MIRFSSAKDRPDATPSTVSTRVDRRETPSRKAFRLRCSSSRSAAACVLHDVGYEDGLDAGLADR